MQSPIARPFAESFRFSDNVIRIVTSDLTDEQARYRTRDGAGPSIAWILGHLCQFRGMALGLLGAPAPTPAGSRVGDTATEGDGYPAVGELREEFLRLGESLAKALGAVPAERFLAQETDDVHGASTLAEKLAFFPWHEASHFGQAGLLRKELGLKAIADLVMEARGTAG